MHGNEAVGRELLLRLASDICKGWRNMDPKINQLVTLTRIHLLPSMNPDGWYKAFTSEEVGFSDIITHLNLATKRRYWTIKRQ